LHFASKRVVSIEQTFTSVWPEAKASGFARSVRITGLLANEAVYLRVADSENLSISKRGRLITLPGGEARIHLSGPATARFVRKNGAIHATQAPTRTPDHVEIKLHYVTKRPVPPVAIDSNVRRAVQPVDLAVMPGFRATRLSLPAEIMPTGLAWRPDGTLVISSLKGRVWLAHDRNGDGLEDHAVPFSDELAAPYGVATRGEAIDVITKSALLRLLDVDNDGRADRTITLASGWGHTADYHDWTVGLVGDPAGNYYVALPCQQDKRTDAAAHLRGTVLKLVPRTPDQRDPRPFAIKPLTAGHRFPMGLARNRRGDLFVTDNQGHWNPFNKLNHVVAGSRYGFINANDRTKGFDPQARPAAIEIPHPWTRSVNGICFLDTPAEVRKKTGRDLFGPLEGHLIGCEYDTRRLVRMSLQRVGETYQGACYPFSIQPLKGRPALLGPIVCSVAPDGDLYIGNIRDSGWGGGQNVGSVVRLRPDGKLPCGIAEVRADAEGFLIDLTAPADARRMADVTNYTVSSYRRRSTPAYGGKDQDRRTETIQSVSVSDDRLHITLRIRQLRAGYVYDLRLKNLVGEGETFFPAEAYYTLRTIPE
jgi:glucose/arabinose dehydrogenase